MRAYNLNAQAAMESDGFARIDQSGQHEGVFTKAKAIKSDKGTEGIEFSFKSDAGQEAGFLTVYTHNAKGEEIFGYKQLCAIMTCLGVKQINGVASQIEEYNFKSSQKEMVHVTLYPDLMQKRIGLVLQKELYTKENGEDGERMQFFGFYDAATGCTAKEKLKQLPPQSLDSMVKFLGDKDARRTKAVSASSQPGNAHEQQQSLAEFDDDIPF